MLHFNLVMLLCVCSQIFPISSKDDLADGSFLSDSTGVGGGSLITTPPRSKSHNSISEASWLFWLASVDFARDSVTTHSSRSHNDNTESVLIGRILALCFNYFLNVLIYLLQRMAIIYKMNKTNMIIMFPSSTPPNQTKHHPRTHRTRTRTTSRVSRSLIYTYRVPHSFWKEWAHRLQLFHHYCIRRLAKCSRATPRFFQNGAVT